MRIFAGSLDKRIFVSRNIVDNSDRLFPTSGVMHTWTYLQSTNVRNIQTDTPLPGLSAPPITQKSHVPFEISRGSSFFCLPFPSILFHCGIFFFFFLLGEIWDLSAELFSYAARSLRPYKLFTSELLIYLFFFLSFFLSFWPFSFVTLSLSDILTYCFFQPMIFTDSFFALLFIVMSWFSTQDNRDIIGRFKPHT